MYTVTLWMKTGHTIALAADNPPDACVLSGELVHVQVAPASPMPVDDGFFGGSVLTYVDPSQVAAITYRQTTVPADHA